MGHEGETSHVGTRPRTLLEQKIRERRLTFAEFAEVAEEFARKNKHVGTLSFRHLQRLIAGKGPNGAPLGPVRPATTRLLEEMLGISIERLLGPPEADHEPVAPHDSSPDDEIAAIELARRFSHSGVGSGTLDQLEAAFDVLAMDYPVTPPAVLLPRIRGHLRYVTQLMEGRKTLSERIRLTTTAGWLSLLAGTVNIDLGRHNVAMANLQAASSLAKDVDNGEIRAWCYETAAWQVLTDGDYQNALELSRAAQGLAIEGSSISVQAAAQEARALARLGKAAETYEVLNRVHRAVSTLSRPKHPEHHYRYDPDKSTAYTATTLAWVGDCAAESYAREVIDRLSPSEDLGKWPRRVATAKLDLSLALIAGDKPDEASAIAQQAILSGRIVPSNRWRAAEIVNKLEKQRIPEASELRDAFNTACPPPGE